MAGLQCKNRMSYGEISERIHRATLGKRFPLDGMIELTMRCNLACRPCYCAKDPTRPELDTGQVLALIDQIVQAGCLWLAFTGGEILLRQDFLEIYRHAKEKGLLVSLLTNGTLLDEKTVRCFATYKPLQVEITLYGMTEETYVKVTGVAGMLKKALEGVRLLKDYAIPFNLKTCVTKDNVSEIGKIQEFCSGIGADYRFDAQIHARIDGVHAPHQYRLSPREVAELDIIDQGRAGEWKRFCKQFWGPIPFDSYFYCAALVYSFHIDAYGRLLACVLSRAVHEDLLEEPFSACWERLYQRLYAIKARKDFACRGCKLAYLCDNCPGWAEVEHGSWDMPAEYLCELTKQRERLFRSHGIIDHTQEGTNEEKISASQSA